MFPRIIFVCRFKYITAAKRSQARKNSKCPLPLANDEKKGASTVFALAIFLYL